MLALTWLMDMPDQIAIGIECDLPMDGIEIGVGHKSLHHPHWYHLKELPMVLIIYMMQIIALPGLKAFRDMALGKPLHMHCIQ